MTEQKRPHHMTLKRMVRDGELTQELADEVKRDERTVESALSAMQEHTLPKPESRISKDDTSTSKLCLCGCGETLGSGKRNFRQGHDSRLVTMAKEYVKGERELTPDQLQYVQESGKLDRARAQLEKEEQRKQEKAQAKADKQRKREGEAEQKSNE